MTAKRVELTGLFDGLSADKPAPKPCERCGQKVAPLELGAALGGWFVPPICEACVEADRLKRAEHERAARIKAWRSELVEQMGGDLYLMRRVELPTLLESFAAAGGWMEGQSAVYLTGGVGTGKTQAMAEMAQRVIERLAGEPLARCPVAYATIHDLLAALRQRESVERFIKAPWLFLDEIGAVALTDWGHEQVYTLINGRAASRKPTVFASNYHLVDLLMWGGVAPESVPGIGRAYGVVGWDHRVVTRLMAMCGGQDADHRLPGVITFERAWRMEVRR